MAEAKAAISKANPDYKLSPLMLTNGKEAGVTAVTGDRLTGTGTTHPGGASDEFVALTTDAGKIWFVARVQRFDEGGRIGVDALKEALTEKFGTPSPSVSLMGLSISLGRPLCQDCHVLDLAMEWSSMGHDRATTA